MAERTWKWRSKTEWHRDEGGEFEGERLPGGLVKQLLAQRSDGVHFFARAKVGLDATPEEMDQSVAQAELLLESFRNCDCQVDAPCPEHAHLHI